MTALDSKAQWPGWKTVRLIGRGSYGAVYEIERDVLGTTEKAALKVITIPQNSSDIDELYSEGYDEQSITDTFRQYLRSIVGEYLLMRKLNGSANVVNCDDVLYTPHDDGIGWDIFLKLELLTPMLKAAEQDLPEEHVIRLGADICKALVLCEKHNILHRDIKPTNIFVSENGDYKLGDFGIAKTVEKTSGGTRIGTYDYMAPEVYYDEPYGRAADLYSLGLVLYWLLNERRAPFLPLPPALPTASAKEQARRRRFSGEAIPAPKHGSEALQGIVRKACAYTPKDRYQSAEEMLRDLEALEKSARIMETKQDALSVPKETIPEEGTVGLFSRAAYREESSRRERTIDEVSHQASASMLKDAEQTPDSKRGQVSAMEAGSSQADQRESTKEENETLSVSLDKETETDTYAQLLTNHVLQPGAQRYPDFLRVWRCRCGYRNRGADYCMNCGEREPNKTDTHNQDNRNNSSFFIARDQKRLDVRKDIIIAYDSAKTDITNHPGRANNAPDINTVWRCKCGYFNPSVITVCMNCGKRISDDYS